MARTPEDDLIAYAQRSPHIRKLINRIAAITFCVTALVSSVTLIATAYRTGFAPNQGDYRTGTVTIDQCRPWVWQLGTAQRCTATLEQWNDDVRPGLDLTDAEQLIVISRTPLTGSVEVASRKGWTAEQMPGGAQNVATEIIMPLDQQPWPGWLSILSGFGCLVLAFVAMAIASKISRPWLLKIAAAERAQSEA